MVLIDRGGRFYPPRYGFIALACQAIASCRLLGRRALGFFLPMFLHTQAMRLRTATSGRDEL